MVPTRISATRAISLYAVGGPRPCAACRSSGRAGATDPLPPEYRQANPGKASFVPDSPPRRAYVPLSSLKGFVRAPVAGRAASSTRFSSFCGAFAGVATESMPVRGARATLNLPSE